MNHLKCQELSQHPRASKYNDNGGLLLHKRKDRECSMDLSLYHDRKHAQYINP